MTTFSTALQICGLSHKEAAEFFDVRLDTVKSWSAGRNPVPDGVWRMIASLYDHICNTAEATVEAMEDQPIDPRAFNNITGQDTNDPLPSDSCTKVAGTMALLIRLHEETTG